MRDLSSSEVEGDSSLDGESDSATEMALISESFRIAPGLSQTIPAATIAQPEQSTDHSSQDTTLHELQGQARSAKAQGSFKSECQKLVRQPSRRGVPMREEFFANIGWTRSFIFGPQTPSKTRTWSGAICAKNFSIRTKGPVEILRHHRKEKHLKRDQRWPYEHLKSVDSVNRKVQHRVRDRNAKALTKI